ncbi:MAG: hypothetical protein SWY16_09840 [Cyanobacteriota bacterium]|nr:hypothetical protein [Cyanobacteriota bacterium]
MRVGNRGRCVKFPDRQLEYSLTVKFLENKGDRTIFIETLQPMQSNGDRSYPVDRPDNSDFPRIATRQEEWVRAWYFKVLF